MPWPGDIDSVTITWMDGLEETYKCNTIDSKDGSLVLDNVRETGIGFQRRIEYRIPLDNVRAFIVNRVEV